AEPVAPVVARPAELGLAADRLDQALVRLDAKVAAANTHRCAGLDRFDRAARIAVGAVQPVIEAPDEAVDAMLLIALLEAGEQDDLLVRLAVAVGVLGIKDFGSAGDNDALAPGSDAGRIAEVVEEDGGLVIGTVARPGFLQEFDPATELVLAID